MPCFKPLKAYYDSGQVVFAEPRFGDYSEMSLPCGQCVGCRLERSRQWAIRCMHEAQLYKRNCFITLTYDEDHLPIDRSLDYRHFQLFMKKLRKHYSGYDAVDVDGVLTYPIRFYMAGEYGENFGRPHFHACLFNFDFPDKVFYKKTGSGSAIYNSKILDKIWGQGFTSIGDVTFQSAAYVARYIMKKVNGDSAKSHYIDSETGVCIKPEFNKMSLKPGIGFNWYDKYKTDVYPHDYVVVNGKKVKPPKYYDRKFQEEFPVEYDMIAFEREVDAGLRYLDNTPARLAVKEQVTNAKLNKLPRTLK